MCGASSLRSGCESQEDVLFPPPMLLEAFSRVAMQFLSRMVEGSVRKTKHRFQGGNLYNQLKLFFTFTKRTLWKGRMGAHPKMWPYPRMKIEIELHEAED